MGVENIPLLHAENIYKEFSPDATQKKNIRVLKGINFTLYEGEIVSIVGASGSGKSTFLHILGTLDTPSAGNVYYKNRNVQSMRDDELMKLRNREIGFVFQFHHLLPEFTALENIMLPSMVAGEQMKRAKQRATELLCEVGLEERMFHTPNELSGGEQQRVAIARALVNEPHIVFADEPTGNLDSENSEQLQELFLKFNKERNQAFVIVTHSELFAEKSNRILRIADGNFVTP
ncbi:MAG: ABC transporter ATP-binding protein [Bacteroidota bacterium]